MFKDRALILGLAVVTLGVALSVAVYMLAAAFLTVRQEVKLVGLDVSPRSIIFADVGDSEVLSARDYFSDRSLGDWEDDVSYMSTDPSVVSVSARGIVTAQAAGAADIVASRGDFSVDVPVIVYGEVRMPPPVDPDIVGVVPAIDPETPVVLNRLMVELRPGYGLPDAQTLAATIGGGVVFSFRTFPGHIIEFDPSTRDLDAALQALESEPTVEAAYPDAIMEFSHRPTDTFPLPAPSDGLNLLDGTFPYRAVGFERAWEMMARIDDLAPVNIAVIDTGFQDPAAFGDPKDSNLRAGLEANFPKTTFRPFSSASESGSYFGDSGNIIVSSRNPLFGLTSQTTDPYITSHGTAVVSVIAAANNRDDDLNSKSELSGVVASVPNLDYNLHVFSIGFLGKAMWPFNITSTFQHIATLESIEKRQRVIDVVNMSFGGSPSNPVIGIENTKRRGLAEDMSGITFVAAAGNCGEDASKLVPANWSQDWIGRGITMPGLPNAITVGGTDGWHIDRWRSADCGSNSAYGAPISETGVAAPAQDVKVIKPEGDGYYDKGGGTSIAAPMVTGTVALLRAISPYITPSKIREILRDSAEMVDICTSNHPKDSCPDGDKEKWPFLRADKAVDMLLRELVEAEIDPPPPLTPASASGWAAIDATVRNTGKRSWDFYAEAWARSPSGDEYPLHQVILGGRNNVASIPIPPGGSDSFTWIFSPFQLGVLPPLEPGVWDLKIVVKRDDINDPDMDAELSNDRVLAVSDWGEAKIEVLASRIPTPAGTPIASAALPATTPTALPTALPTATPTALPTATPQPPSGRIAFMSDRDGNNEIYTMNADGSGVTRLTDNDVDDTEPSWSPDGQRIAFTSDRDGNSEIYTMNADGSGVTRLTDGNRDGELEYVVYSSSDGSVGRYTRPADDVPSWSPSWSPDGQRIAFISSRGRIHTMNADGSGVTDIGSSGNSPSWSPDGQRIAFEASNKIYVANADGSGDAILVHSDEISGSPSWSPGPVIAFDYIVGFSEVEYGNWWHQGRLERERSRGREIYVMSPGQYSNTQRLTDSHYDTWSPSWSPDGRHIVFIRSDRSIYTMNADGSGVTSIGSGTSPSWGPAP